MATIKATLVEIYSRLLEIRAVKGGKSLWPGERYKHVFHRTGTKVYGVEQGGLLRVRAGDLVIRNVNGHRLWKRFAYGEEDIE